MADTSTDTQGNTKDGNGSSPQGGLTGAAGQVASGLLAQVKSRASSQVAAQQAKAAEGLGSVATALRKAGNELRTHNEGLASYADMAVDELEHISNRIREKSPGEYVRDLEHFARRRPAAFIGGSFLLGLGLARFLKSTQPRSSRSYGQGGYRGFQEQEGAGYRRSYDAPGSMSGMQGRRPEWTGVATPGAGTPSSASPAPGTVGASWPSPTSVDTTGNAGTESGSRARHTEGTVPSSSRAGNSPAGRGRGTGDQS
jgi:hypothetical protein